MFVSYWRLNNYLTGQLIVIDAAAVWGQAAQMEELQHGVTTDSCRLACVSPIAYRSVTQEARDFADQVTAVGPVMSDTTGCLKMKLIFRHFEIFRQFCEQL
jgi:hypothetical protein